MKKLFLSLLLFTAGVAQAADQAMIVFDASGSMWGRVDGREKIAIAKDALKQVVGQWNPKTQLGLMAYGHRQKGNCNDIEVLVPISGFNKQALLKQVKSIQPKGKTPISRSLRQAANTLRYTEDKATVILISDGKETCDLDPCATAKQLKKQGIDFVTHVIGFNVDKATDAQLSCVARATGGQYFSAKNAQALNNAMRTVVHTVQKVEPKPKPKPKPKPASKYNLRIKAFETEGGKQVEAYHRIYRPIDEDNSKQIEYCYSYVEKACKKRIPVGEYFLVSTYNEFEVKTPFTITAGKYTDLNVVMGQTGKVKIKAFETEGGKQVEAYHRIYRPIDEDNSKQIEYCYSYVEKACKKRIPVGEYFLV
ncbi:VWA domain-containing protein, partial [Pasteurella skyensis]